MVGHMPTEDESFDNWRLDLLLGETPSVLTLIDLDCERVGTK